MKTLLRAAELKEADRRAICEIGLPSAVLMERAALAVTEELAGGGYDLAAPLVVCGTGNNGGDGVAVARQLAERGFRPRVCCVGDAERQSEDLRAQLAILKAYAVPVETAFAPDGATVLVDALFGIGLSREVTGETAALIRAMNETGLPIVAVDVPSGLHPDTGQVLGEAVRATTTVTFTAASPGLYLNPGARCSGRVLVREIGIPIPEDRELPAILCAEDADLAELRERTAFGNKGTYGKVLVIAGSESICGAAYLAAKAALLSGAGMVRVLTHRENREPLSRMFPEALLSVYTDADGARAELEDALSWADVCVVGPGLSTNELSRSLWEAFLAKNTLPAVLDADALNLLAESPDSLSGDAFPCVLTPHVGEMARLLRKSVAEIQADPVACAAQAAARWKATCVCKDARTVTAEPTGTIWLNVSGNSALATAGSGDVLAGLLGGLLAQKRGQESRVAPLAVFLHGRIGEKASEDLGKAAVTASDLLARIHEFM